MNPLALLLALIGLLTAPPALAQCTTSWTNAGGGAWTDGASWSAGVPSADDHACITLAGTYTVTLDADADVGALTHGGALGTQTLALGPGRTLAVSAPSRIASTGVLDWTGGTILTGASVLVNDGLIRLTGEDQKRLGVGGSATLLNQGTLAWAAGGLQIGVDAVVENHGLFDVQGDLFNTTGGVLRNRSTGILRKSAGGTFATLFARVENEGLVESLSGLLQLGGGSLHVDARLEAVAGAEVQLYNATHTVAGTLSGSPNGTVSFIQSSLLAGPGGATLDFAGTGFEWGGGRMEGAGSITNAGLLRLTGLGSKHLADAATLANTGTVVWEGGALTLGSGVTIENAGLLDARGDFSLEATGAGGLFVNAKTGRFRKSGGTTAGFVGRSVHFVNEAGGVISAESGVLAFFDLDHQSGALVQGTSIFAAGSAFNHDGDAAPGPGIGTLTWYADYAPASTSTLFVELSSSGHDRLVGNGPVSLDGVLHLDFPGLYAPRVGDAFEVLSAAGGNLSGTFAAVEAPVGFAFDVAYAPSGVTVTVTEEPDVVVSAMAEHAPFVIPPEGGDLRFAVRLANTTDQVQAVDVWAEAVLPGGAVVPVRQRALTLPPEATVTRYFRLHVPGRAPAGTYTMRLLAGTHPDEIGSADDFAFEKAAPAPTAAAGEPLAWRMAEDGADAYALVAADAAASAEEALPEALALHAAYPNPFAGRATLRYDLPEAATVRLAVYDVLGREVAVLADAEIEAGRHQVVLDGHGLAAGVYVVRMAAGARALTQRVTLVR